MCVVHKVGSRWFWKRIQLVYNVNLYPEMKLLVGKNLYNQKPSNQALDTNLYDVLHAKIEKRTGKPEDVMLRDSINNSELGYKTPPNYYKL